MTEGNGGKGPGGLAVKEEVSAAAKRNVAESASALGETMRRSLERVTGPLTDAIGAIETAVKEVDQARQVQAGALFARMSTLEKKVKDAEERRKAAEQEVKGTLEQMDARITYVHNDACRHATNQVESVIRDVGKEIDRLGGMTAEALQRIQYLEEVAGELKRIPVTDPVTGERKTMDVRAAIGAIETGIREALQGIGTLNDMLENINAAIVNAHQRIQTLERGETSTKEVEEIKTTVAQLAQEVESLRNEVRKVAHDVGFLTLVHPVVELVSTVLAEGERAAQLRQGELPQPLTLLEKFKAYIYDVVAEVMGVSIDEATPQEPAQSNEKTPEA